MISGGKLINTPRKGLDTYYVVDSQSVGDTCCEDIDFQKNPTPIVTDSLPLLNISVETTKIDNSKYKSSSRDSSQVALEQVVAMKACFINKIHELKDEICCLKNQLEDGEKNSGGISVVNFYKSEISLLKDQNSFLKSGLQQKQVIVEKLLQKDQSKTNCSNKVHNKHDNGRSNFDRQGKARSIQIRRKLL